MNKPVLDARREQMLELLSDGASARVIARKLGYSEGTMRVYLHNLYRAIGVRNKTEAVIWHLHRTRPADVAPPAAAPLHGGAIVAELALTEDLYVALGAMSAFVGPYGQVWEFAQRLKGVALDEATLVRRSLSRLVWRALLKGDFAYGKGLYDDGSAERLALDSPSDAMLLALLLVLGGYSGAADRLAARLVARRRPGAGVSAREAAFLTALHGVVEQSDEAGLAALRRTATDGTRAPLLKQLAIVALFHVYRARRNGERAGELAEALWADAEAARRELEAMGIRPLGRDLALARAAKPEAGVSVPAGEKAVAAR